MKNFLTSADFKRTYAFSASVDPTLTPDAYKAAVFEAIKLGTSQVRVRSRGRKYTFYWFRRGKHMAVKVGPKPNLPSYPSVEALATELEREQRAAWKCKFCGVGFQRVGKREYCSDAHATKARKQRWTDKHKAEVLEAQDDAERLRQRVESARLIARNEQLRRKRKPTLRPRGARLTVEETAV